MALIYEDEKEQVFVDKKRLSVQGLKVTENPLNYKVIIYIALEKK